MTKARYSAGNFAAHIQRTYPTMADSLAFDEHPSKGILVVRLAGDEDGHAAHVLAMLCDRYDLRCVRWVNRDAQNRVVLELGGFVHVR